MTVKEIAIKTFQQLPSDATWEDIQERINSVAGSDLYSSLDLSLSLTAI